MTGYKTEWSGEVEIAEGAAIEIQDGSFTASATDVTDLLAKEDELIKHQNELVSFKGMTVETYEKDGQSYDCAVVYNDDNLIPLPTITICTSTYPKTDRPTPSAWSLISATAAQMSTKLWKT